MLWSVTLCLIFILGCEHPEPPSSEYYQEDIELYTLPHLVDFTLQSGTVDANNQVHVVNSPIVEIVDGGSQAWTEVIATVGDVHNYDVNLLRIYFTSDHVDWVGSASGSTYIFDSEEDCLGAGVYCDGVEAATGVSGIFEDKDEAYIGVQVAACYKHTQPYTLTISAAIYDISEWDPIQVSKVRTIEIECR